MSLENGIYCLKDIVFWINSNKNLKFSINLKWKILYLDNVIIIASIAIIIN